MNNITMTIVPQTASIVDGTKTYFCSSEPGRATSEAKWSIYLVETGVTLLGKTATTVKLPCWPGGKPTSAPIFKLDDALDLTYSYVSDVVVPTLATVTIASNNSDTAKAKVGDTVTLTVVASEALSAISGTIAGHTATVTAGSDASQWTLSFVMTSGDLDGTVPFTIDFSDISGNAGVQVTATTNASAVTFDKTAPVFTLTSLLSNNADTARAKSGDVVTLIFTTSETLTANPTVTFGGASMTFSTLVTGTYTYTRTINGTEAVGAIPALVTGTDLTGNTTTNTSLGSLTTDFTVPTMLSAVDDTVTQITVTLSELALASTISKLNDGGFVVADTVTPATTYAVSAINPGATNDLVVLTVADMTASALVGVTVTYVAGGNGTVSDLVGNLLATDAVGVVTGAF